MKILLVLLFLMVGLISAGQKEPASVNQKDVEEQVKSCESSQNPSSCLVENNNDEKTQQQSKQLKGHDSKAISLLNLQIEAIEQTIEAHQKKLKLIKQLRDELLKQSSAEDNFAADKITFQQFLQSSQVLIKEDKEKENPKLQQQISKILPAKQKAIDQRFSSRALIKQRMPLQQIPYLTYTLPIKNFNQNKNMQQNMGLFTVYKEKDNNSKIVLTDLYFNQLITFTVNNQIKLISGIYQQDERLLVLVTIQNKVILYKINQINTKSPDLKKNQRVKKIKQEKHQSNQKFYQKSQASLQTKRNLSIYIYELDQDISERTFDYKQKLKQEAGQITAIETFILRGNKYILLGDSNGRIIVINCPSMEFRNEFLTSTNYITSLKKLMSLSSATVLFSGEHTIGQAKFLQGSLQPTNCDAGSASSKIVSIEIDLSNSGVLYSIVQSGDVYAFEVQRKNMGESCNILSRIRNSEAEGQILPQLHSLKGGLLIKLPDGSLKVINTQKVNDNSSEIQSYLIDKDVRMISGFLNSRTQYFSALKKNQNDGAYLEVYEWNPVNTKENASFFENFGMTKLPIILGVLIVVGYQFYKRKNNQNNLESQKKMKKMKDLKELETLFNTTKNSGNFQKREQQLRNLQKKVDSLNLRTNKKRVSFKEPLEDQENFQQTNFVDDSDDY